MEVSNLKPGDEHYMAYVGPPNRFDFMGATQFRLLCTLGLRSNHSILDLGCGSLRSGRFFLTYLDEGHYFGIEPNKWLIDDAIENMIGEDLIRIKKPQFNYNSEFDTGVFAKKFDFIIAQSIFSHTGQDLIKIALNNSRESLAPDGQLVITFMKGDADFEGDGWIYPRCVRYQESTILTLGEEAGLHIKRIPWYHPSQTWFVLSKNPDRLPSEEMMQHLRGAVLFDPQFEKSHQSS